MPSDRLLPPRILEASYTSDGKKVDARLLLPEDGTRPWPAVLLLPSRIRSIRGLRWVAEPIVDSGIAVLGITYRGELHFPTGPTEDVVDARNGLEFLRRFPGVDPDRLAIVGHSRGGTAALLTAAEEPKLRGIVALSPWTDFIRYFEGLRLYDPLWYQRLLKDGKTLRPEELKLISPVHIATRIQVPVLLIHGLRDALVPSEQSRLMVEALKKSSSSKTEFEWFELAGHWFEEQYDGYAHDRVTQRVLSWLKQRFQAPA